jgi:hypothetical protein
MLRTGINVVPFTLVIQDQRRVLAAVAGRPSPSAILHVVELLRGDPAEGVLPMYVQRFAGTLTRLQPAYTPAGESAVP